MLLVFVCLPICATNVSDLIHESGIWGNGLDLCWLRQYHETPQETVSVRIIPSDTHLKGQKPFWSKPKPSFSLWKCSRGNVFSSSPQHFIELFEVFLWRRRIRHNNLQKAENIVTISSRREGALLCIHMSRDQCSEHSHVKWRFSLHKECFFSQSWHRGFQCSGLGAGQAQLCVVGVQGDRQERGRQTGWIRETGRSSGQLCGELRNAPLAPQLPTEPVVFLWQHTLRPPPPQDLQLLWSSSLPSFHRMRLLALWNCMVGKSNSF